MRVTRAEPDGMRVSCEPFPVSCARDGRSGCRRERSRCALERCFAGSRCDTEDTAVASGLVAAWRPAYPACHLARCSLRDTRQSLCNTGQSRAVPRRYRMRVSSSTKLPSCYRTETLDQRRPSLKANPDRCPECRSLKTRASVDGRSSVFRRCEMCDHQWSSPKPRDYASF